MAVKKVGIALGSGAARGWAHIGVLEALDENHIPVDYIAGASIGSFVGAIYASGRLVSLKDFALQMDWKSVISYFDVVFPRSGFLDGKKVKKLFSMHTNKQTFDDLGIPLCVIAADMTTGERVVINSGNIIDGIRASISIPGVFTPVRRDGMILIDGGTVDPVPVKAARDMGSEVVIAVNLNSGLGQKRRKRREAKADKKEARRISSRHEINNEFITRIAQHYDNAEAAVKNRIAKWINSEDNLPGIMEVTGASLGIMQEKIAQINLSIDQPDILLEPELFNIRLFDFDQAEKAIAAGYELTMERMKDIEKVVG